MKKLSGSFKLWLAICGLFAWLSNAKAQYTLQYATNGGVITLTSCSGNPVSVVVPNFVTSIGDDAFYYCFSLADIVIPNSVTIIGNSSFAVCIGLTNIIIPNSVSNIGDEAFELCNGLTSIIIPSSVTNIGNFTFGHCSGLTNIGVSSGNLNYAGVGGVLFNKNLNSLIEYPEGQSNSYLIPNSVNNIGTNAFGQCTNLTNITIPNSVTNIGDGAFNDCTSLTSITIPNNVTIIGDYTFKECFGLTNITIPNILTSIGDEAFFGCAGLTIITIPDTVTNIGEGVFEYCIGLTSITIPNSVTSIGEFVFNQCSNLTNITISENVTNIGDSAFQQCYSLTSITIPNSISSIGDGAFAECTGLTNIIIPNNVNAIGDYAFVDCSNLSQAYFTGNAPYFGTNVFNGSPTIIYYTAGATGWATNISGLPSIQLTVNCTNSPFTGQSPLTVYFASTTTNVAGNTITNWLWTFGDGSTSTLQNPVHIYTNVGLYVPILTTTDNLGLAASGSGLSNVFVSFFSLGTSSLLEGPNPGSDSVVLGAISQTILWTNTSNSPWLHLTSANQSGRGSTNIIFSFDANPGPTRVGNLNIAGQMLAVTQAGSSYIQAPSSATALTDDFQGDPYGVAVDSSGNVYYTDFNQNQLWKWTPAYGFANILLTNGLHGPTGITVDLAGNVYIADDLNFAVKEYFMTNGYVTNLVSSGLNHPNDVAIDAVGNVYIADSANEAIREFVVASNSLITLVSSGLSSPNGVAVDVAGNVYFSDSDHQVVKEWIAANSNVITIVSSGLVYPCGVALDGSGNIYIADINDNSIKTWSAASNILFTNVQGLSSPSMIAVDYEHNLYIADQGMSSIKELQSAFLDITPKSYSVFGGFDSLPLILPTAENINYPFDLYSDSSWVNITGATNGQVSFFVQTNATPYVRTAHIYLLGTNIAITQATAPPPVITTEISNVVVGPGSTAVLTVSATGLGPLDYQWYYSGYPVALNGGIITVAGNGIAGFSGDGGFATNAELSNPSGVAVDSFGNLFIADLVNNRIREVTTNGIISTVAGNGLYGFSGDGGFATNAELNDPAGLSVDPFGNLFIADYGNCRVRKVTTNGIISTVAGNGFIGFSGDGGLAVSARLNYPQGVTVDPFGNLFIADSRNQRIRKVTTNGIISTVSGNGFYGFSGDGGFATNAELNYPEGVSVDSFGNIFIADLGNQRIRKVTTNGIISTVAGNGIRGFSGDGGFATIAELNDPVRVSLEPFGNLFIADEGNDRIREVTTNGIISTIVGNGIAGFSGDGGLAPNAELYNPTGFSADPFGNLFIADLGNQRVREITTSQQFFSTGPNLTISNLNLYSAGNYTCIVFSPYGSVTSSVATVTINYLPPAGLAITTVSNQPVLFWQPSAINYVLQMTTNLASGNWITVTNGVPYAGVLVTNVPTPNAYRLQ